MNPYEANALARLMIEDRLGEADRARLARDAKRRERPTGAPTAVQQPRRHSRLWSLVHFHHAYS